MYCTVPCAPPLGGFLRVVNVSLPKATFVKFRPQSVDFLEISNPRAVLERALRNFSCVTVGDHICIPYNNKYYYLEVREVKPADAACIIETDCNVDFEAPVGYKEPERKMDGGKSGLESKGGMMGGAVAAPGVLSAKGGYVSEKKDEDKPKAFTGTGQRLDGKSSRSNSIASEAEAAPLPTPPPPTTALGVPRPLGGRTIAGGTVPNGGGGGHVLGGGQRLGGGSGEGSSGGRPIGALGGKFSTKKNFASFGGQGNTLK